MPALKGRYWLLTIPHADFKPSESLIRNDLVYIKGQHERGTSSGYEHWQILVAFSKQITLNQCKGYFTNTAHCELSRSSAANDYVWKEESRIGEQFVYGKLPISRARKPDWDAIFESAKEGDMDAIPSDIKIRHYSALKRIRVDNSTPPTRDSIEINVYWGDSGTGKTRRAWYEAGDDVYIKNPNTKWWDGYRGQTTVIIDEFTGRIDLSYLLTWFDRYPCNVEVKGYSTPLLATRFFITSNINPVNWYSDINEEQRRGLLRRLSQVVFFSSDNPWSPPEILNLTEVHQAEKEMETLINDLFS